MIQKKGARKLKTRKVKTYRTFSDEMFSGGRYFSRFYGFAQPESVDDVLGCVVSSSERFKG